MESTKNERRIEELLHEIWTLSRDDAEHVLDSLEVYIDQLERQEDYESHPLRPMTEEDLDAERDRAIVAIVAMPEDFFG